MDKKTITLVIALISLVFLFSGCTFGGKEPATLFVGGDKALEFKFSSNAPPGQIRANELFYISLYVENKGEAEVKQGELRLDLNNGAIFDVKPEGFTKTNNNRLAPIVKQEAGSLPGGFAYIEYTDLKYIDQETLTEEAPISISLEACYPYKTTAISTICIAREAESSRVCTPIGEKEKESSGSPIKINKFEQQSNGVLHLSEQTAEEKNTVTTRVVLEISKVGEARIYPVDYNCETKKNLGGEGITVKSISIDNLNINVSQSCKDDDVFFNDAGTGKLICSLTVPDVKADYEGRFAIVFQYKISEVMNRGISILPF